jgi:hypothetical protein
VHTDRNLLVFYPSIPFTSSNDAVIVSSNLIFVESVVSDFPYDKKQFLRPSIITSLLLFAVIKHSSILLNVENQDADLAQRQPSDEM